METDSIVTLCFSGDAGNCAVAAGSFSNNTSEIILLGVQQTDQRYLATAAAAGLGANNASQLIRTPGAVGSRCALIESEVKMFGPGLLAADFAGTLGTIQPVPTFAGVNVYGIKRLAAFTGTVSDDLAQHFVSLCPGRARHDRELPPEFDGCAAFAKVTFPDPNTTPATLKDFTERALVAMHVTLTFQLFR